MALFSTLAELADRLAADLGRLTKRSAIADALSAIHAAEPATNSAGLFALYLAGLPFAEADPRKLNAGGALLAKSILAVTGVAQIALTAAYRRHGDLGAATHDLLADTLSSHNPSSPLSSRSTPSSLSSRSAAEGSAFASLPPTLTLQDLATAFDGMATARTTAIRAALVEDLLRRATPTEAKYLVKLMLGDMRIGVKQSLIEEAIAIAAAAPVQQVRHAVMLEADLAAATARAFAGILAEARMRLFHPLGFMLASPVDTPEQAIDRFTEKPPTPPKAKAKRGKKYEEQTADSSAALRNDNDLLSGNHPSPLSSRSAAEGSASPLPVEPREPPPTITPAFLEDKYDGIRAQIHCGDPGQPGRVAIYSRNREDITTSFPELAEAFAHVLPDLDGPLIFDGEILGWNYTLTAESAITDLEARALPFATLGQRIGRKKVTNEWRRQVPVIFMAFDLIYARGSLLLDRPLSERRALLEHTVEQMVDRIVAPLVLNERSSQADMFLDAPDANPAETPRPRLLLAPSRLVQSAEDIDRAYTEARARANEGVMLKSAASLYQPGRRGLAWLKLKRELATLDVVITGAEYGHGRRAGLLSDYTFAVRGPSYKQNGELLNVGKAYSGVTDLEIAELTELLKAHTLEDHGHFRTVEPLIILEVAFNNIMRSPRHASGFALRFPRILRIRTDKPLEEIDTLANVEAIYLSQIDRPVEDASQSVSEGQTNRD